MKTNNPYVQQLIDQGDEPTNQPAYLGEFPKTIWGVIYNTQDEYIDAVHEFLNGN